MLYVQAVQSVLYSLNIERDVWRSTYDEDFWQVRQISR